MTYPGPPPRPVAICPDIAARFGSRLVRLASNENPLGPSPRAKRVLRRLREAHRYPDPDGRQLRRALSRHHDWPIEGIMLGAGASELIDLLARTWLPPGGEAVISEHAFLAYRAAVAAAGGIAVPVPMRAGRHDLAAMAVACTDRTRLVFIALPNNPTGTWNSGPELADLLDRVPPRCLVVIDQAYFEYATAADYPDAIVWLRQGRPLVVLRTFSKIYGLADLRIGYALAEPSRIETLDRRRSPYNTSGRAQQAARAALEDVGFVRRCRSANTGGRRFLRAELERRGWTVADSQANFLFVNRSGIGGAPVAAHLARQGVFVCPLESYGLPGFRVTVGRRTELRRFLRELDRLPPPNR